MAMSLIACQPKQKDTSASAAQVELKADYPKLVEFPSKDSVMITGNLYQIDETSPFILLCHQARFNKFEYSGIAERLNEMGFNCMAIDQRSGGPIGSKQNETYLRALKKGKGIDYVDAEVDIQASIDYITKTYSERVVLWGSSYSSTLALYIAVEREDVSAVLSFSPGNYLADKKGSLIEKLEAFNKPMFLTSSKSEAKYVSALLEKHELLQNQVQFVPEGAGHHGSRALWNNQQGGEEYWLAITNFLNQLK
jgi:dienelactone hydrolase